MVSASKQSIKAYTLDHTGYDVTVNVIYSKDFP